MKIKMLIVSSVIVLGFIISNNAEKGIIVNDNYIQLKNGGYYTEKSLNGEGDRVLIMGDLMINSKGLKYLK